MVDASAGGKTGINFNGLKNEIGAFSPARFVLLDTEFLRSLDDENIRSGYAEMLKHGLISDTEHWAELLNFDPARPDYDALRSLVSRSVSIKERIVEQDPREKGIRKALNFGHTAGHAFESLALEQGRPRLHGYAVAWGIVCELYLSCLRTGFPKDKLRQTVQFIKETYGTFDFDCKQYDRLYEFMTHDKKNESDAVNFTLLATPAEGLSGRFVRMDQKKFGMIPGVTVLLLVGSLISSFALNGSQILPVYCSGNPACSIRSDAYFPLIAALAVLAVAVIAAVKYHSAHDILSGKRPVRTGGAA